MIPQIALLLINATAIVVGLSVINNPVTTGITVALCVLHVLILGRVLLAAVTERRSARALPTMPVIDLRDPAPTVLSR